MQRRILGNEGEELHALALRIAREDAPEIAAVARVHVDDVVPIRIFAGPNEASAVMSHGNANLIQLVDRTVVGRIAKLLITRAGGVDHELALASRATDEVLHNELSHGRATDVTEADEQDAMHGGTPSLRVSGRLSNHSNGWNPSAWQASSSRLPSVVLTKTD